MTSDGGAILVLGATGKQGGAVARHLLARGRHVHALVRDPADPAAADLAAGGGELVQANLDDPTGIRTAVAGAAGVFCVLPYQPGHPEAEVRQGITVANAAAAAGIAHLVYSSAAGADRGIGIPETDSKWAIEQHLAALDLPVTVLRPTFLMKNFAIPELKQAILGGSLHFAMRADTRLQMVAADDVGAMAALAFDDPDALRRRPSWPATSCPWRRWRTPSVGCWAARSPTSRCRMRASPSSTPTWLPLAPGWTAKATGPTSLPCGGCTPACGPWRPGCARPAGRASRPRPDGAD